jgi:uncharacterized protein (DUF58 family)
MTADAVRPFVLVPQRRFAGVQFGERRSPRRGAGDEVVGSRPYRPGDLTAWIDWSASARLSAARGTDEFVVREFLAEQAPRVIVVRDRRPAMALYGGDLPWLDKRAAGAEALRQILAAVGAERGELAYTDHDGARPFWLPPRGSGFREIVERRERDAPFGAPSDGLRRSLEAVFRHASLFPVGTFVFVISDFLSPVAARTWVRFRSLRLDLTPVVVQDPVWEQSFPDVGGVVLPLADPATGSVGDVWVGPRAAKRRRVENEGRLAVIRAGFARLGFDPVMVDTADPHGIEALFHAWAERRRRLRRRRV